MIRGLKAIAICDGCQQEECEVVLGLFEDNTISESYVTPPDGWSKTFAGLLYCPTCKKDVMLGR